MTEEADEECSACLEELGDRTERDEDAMGMTGRCIPQAEEVNTGLMVTVTFYVDQECTEELDVESRSDQNRGPNNDCFQLKEAECGEKEGCEYESEGRGRFSTPHCRPEGDAFRRGDGGDGRGDGGRGDGGRGDGGRRLSDAEARGGRGDGRGDGGRGGDGRGGNRPNRESNNQGRGQDFQGRGRGGNPQQNNRIQENPMTRIVPVVDADGATKCSFDARSDQRMGIFRETTCSKPNTMQDTLFLDSACEKPSTRETIPIVRGECIPVPMQGQRMDQRRQTGDGRGGRGGDGDGRDGRRRRLAEKEEESDEDDDADATPPAAPDCDGEWNQGWTWETVVDMWNELTCDSREPDEGSGADTSDADRPVNPCLNLERNDCTRAEACDLQQGICVWNQAPENRRNLYVIYEWQNLVVDGEETDETWCYSADTLFKNVIDYAGMCKEQGEDTCKDMGCSGFKKGMCQAESEEIKCKKLGDKKEAKNSDNKKAICAMYSLLGCEWSDSKGCTGVVNFKDL